MSGQLRETAALPRRKSTYIYVTSTTALQILEIFGHTSLHYRSFQLAVEPHQLLVVMSKECLLLNMTLFFGN
jgi:hypothetical protein